MKPPVIGVPVELLFTIITKSLALRVAALIGSENVNCRSEVSPEETAAESKVGLTPSANTGLIVAP
ncbi:hypothetical protein D3C73_1628500 [compost metagenome]